MRKGFTLFELLFVVVILGGVFIGGAMMLMNAEPKTINGVTYDTYGLMSEGDVRNDDIEYELSVPSIILAVVFSVTVFVPIYQVGWNIYEPVGVRDTTKIKGSL